MPSSNVTTLVCFKCPLASRVFSSMCDHCSVCALPSGTSSFFFFDSVHVSSPHFLPSSHLSIFLLFFAVNHFIQLKRVFCNCWHFNLCTILLFLFMLYTFHHFSIVWLKNLPLLFLFLLLYYNYYIIFQLLSHNINLPAHLDKYAFPVLTPLLSFPLSSHCVAGYSWWE